MPPNEKSGEPDPAAKYNDTGSIPATPTPVNRCTPPQMPWAPHAPFCFQPKEAFDRIFEKLEHPASAAMLYVGLTRIASNEGSDTFVFPLAYIAVLALMDRKTVMRRLPDLERIGLVKVERRKAKGVGT